MLKDLYAAYGQLVVEAEILQAKINQVKTAITGTE